MITDKLGVINLALRTLGMNKIKDLNGNDPSTTVMLDFWDICVESVFGGHQWSFANVQEALVESTETVPFGWLFAYKSPTVNAATVWTVYNEGTLDTKDEQDFDTYYMTLSAATVLVSNLDEALCEYTYYVADPTKWDKTFAHAVAHFLAASACPMLTGDVDKALKIMQIYNGLMSEVKRVDSFGKLKKAKITASAIQSRG